MEHEAIADILDSGDHHLGLDGIHQGAAGGLLGISAIFADNIGSVVDPCAHWDGPHADAGEDFHAEESPGSHVVHDGNSEHGKELSDGEISTGDEVSKLLNSVIPLPRVKTVTV